MWSRLNHYVPGRFCNLFGQALLIFSFLYFYLFIYFLVGQTTNITAREHRLTFTVIWASVFEKYCSHLLWGIFLCLQTFFTSTVATVPVHVKNSQNIKNVAVLSYLHRAGSNVCTIFQAWNYEYASVDDTEVSVTHLQSVRYTVGAKIL